MHNIHTVGDAMKLRHHMKAVFDAKCDQRAIKEAEQKQMIIDAMRANPGIGILMRDGRPMYYINLPNGKIKESRNPATLTKTPE